MESIQATAGVAAPLRVAVGDIVTTVAEDAWQEDADLVVIGRGSNPNRTDAGAHMRTASAGARPARC